MSTEPSHNGYEDYDVFIVKLNSGFTLSYATFLGGKYGDSGRSIAIDSSGNVYVTGRTLSSNFPTTIGAYDTSFDGGYDSDAFVVKLNSSGTALNYATFLGGTKSDEGHALAVDSSGNVYVTGDTISSDFPTTEGALDTSYNGDSVFVSKLNPAIISVLQVSPTSLTFNMTQNGSNPTVKLLNISNNGTGSLTWSASESISWLSLSSSSGTAPSTIDVSINGSGLSAGTYTGQIAVSSNGGNQTVNVTLTVSQPTTTYTVSGKVTDNNGVPLAGVTLTTNSVQTTTTDSQGNYTLSNLAAGSYTFVPNKTGYTFNPASLSVAVPPNATGQNFVGTPEGFSDITVEIIEPDENSSYRPGNSVPLMVRVTHKNGDALGANAAVKATLQKKVLSLFDFSLPLKVDDFTYLNQDKHMATLPIPGPEHAKAGEYLLTIEATANDMTVKQERIINISDQAAGIATLAPTVHCPDQQAGATCTLVANVNFPDGQYYTDSSFSVNLYRDGEQIGQTALKTNALEPYRWEGTYQIPADAVGHYSALFRLNPYTDKYLMSYAMVNFTLYHPNKEIRVTDLQVSKNPIKRYEPVKITAKATLFESGVESPQLVTGAELPWVNARYTDNNGVERAIRLTPSTEAGIYETYFSSETAGNFGFQLTSLGYSLYRGGIAGLYTGQQVVVTNEKDDLRSAIKNMVEKYNDYNGNLKSQILQVAQQGDWFRSHIGEVWTKQQASRAFAIFDFLTATSSLKEEIGPDMTTFLQNILEPGKFIESKTVKQYAIKQVWSRNGEAYFLPADKVGINSTLVKEAIFNTSGKVIETIAQECGKALFTGQNEILPGLDACEGTFHSSVANLLSTDKNYPVLAKEYYLSVESGLNVQQAMVSTIYTDFQKNQSLNLDEAWLNDINLRRRAIDSLTLGYDYSSDILDKEYKRANGEKLLGAKIVDWATWSVETFTPMVATWFNPALGAGLDFAIAFNNGRKELFKRDEATAYMNFNQLAESLISNGERVGKDISITAATGLVGVNSQGTITPVTPGGDFTIKRTKSNSNWFGGKLFEKKAWAEIEVKNTGTLPTSYMVLAQYYVVDRTSGFATFAYAAQQQTGKEELLLKPGESQTVNLYFVDRSDDKKLFVRPEHGGVVRYILLAYTDRGVFEVGNESALFCPWKVLFVCDPDNLYDISSKNKAMPLNSNLSATQITTFTVNTQTTVIPYPIAEQITTLPESTHQTVQISVRNSNPVPIAAIVSQAIPSGVTMVDAQTGQVENSVIRWYDTIPAFGSKTYEYEVNVLGSPTSSISFNPAKLEFYDPTIAEYLTFEGDGLVTNPQSPLWVVNSAAPQLNSNLTTVSIAAGLQNITANSASGTLKLYFNDPTGKELATQTKNVTVSGNNTITETITMNLKQRTMTGTYTVVGTFIDQFNQSQAFYLASFKYEPRNSYLPLIIKTSPEGTFRTKEDSSGSNGSGTTK